MNPRVASGDDPQPRLGRGRRDQEDRVEVVLAPAAASHGPASSGIRSGVITPATTGARQVLGEALHAVVLHRVPVGHDDRRRTCGGQRGDRRQHVADGTPPVQRRCDRLLDDRAVHQRIGVGQADLEDVARRASTIASSAA